MADEYFMNGVVDLSLAKSYEEISQIMNNNENAHNLHSAPKENLRLAIKYQNWEVYSNAKGDHRYVFPAELIKEPERYGFGKFKVGEWYLTSGFVGYEPFDEQKPRYDAIYSYKAGDKDPYYYYE